MNREENLTRLIAEANSVLEKANANTDDAIQYYYNSTTEKLEKECNEDEII